MSGKWRLVAMSFLACVGSCAEGTNSDVPPPIDDDTAGTSGSGGSAGSTSGGGGSGGAKVPPMAGSTTGGGGMVNTSGSGSSGTPAAAGAEGDGGEESGGAGGTSGGGGMGGSGGGGGKAGAGGSGGKAGAGGGGGSGGGPTGHRYARFVATSEVNGDEWSSVAELRLFTTGDAEISRNGWTVTADSEELDDENRPASNAIDGDNATFWHTAWEPPPNDVNDAPLPHQLVIDLGSAKVITGFSYLPRQSDDNGRVEDWAFYVSNTNGQWGTAVKTGTFAAGTAVQKITF